MKTIRDGAAFVARAGYFAEIEIRARPDLWSGQTLTVMTIWILRNAGATIAEIVRWMPATPTCVERSMNEFDTALALGTPEAVTASGRMRKLLDEMGEISVDVCSGGQPEKENVYSFPASRFERAVARVGR